MSFLQIQGLAKRYPGATIFEGVNFAMEKGEFVCIIGHSGCGKTTILNVLAGLDAATTCTVTADNLDGVPAVMDWMLHNAGVFKMISFQPVASVGAAAGKAGCPANPAG